MKGRKTKGRIGMEPQHPVEGDVCEWKEPHVGMLPAKCLRLRKMIMKLLRQERFYY